MEIIIRPEYSYTISRRDDFQNNQDNQDQEDCEVTKKSSLIFHLGEAGGTFGLHRTGQIIWDGSIYLSKLLEYSPPIPIQGCRILELGCGCCAIPGQVAATLGAYVTVTDIGDEISGIKENVRLNSKLHRHPVEVLEFDWSVVMQEQRFPENIDPNLFDLILCADLVYEHTLTSLVWILLYLLIHNPHLIVLMSNANRKHVHLFRRKMSQFCIFEELSVPNLDFTQQQSPLWLFRLKDNVEMEQIRASVLC